MSRSVQWFIQMQSRAFNSLLIFCTVFRWRIPSFCSSTFCNLRIPRQVVSRMFKLQIIAQVGLVFLCVLGFKWSRVSEEDKAFMPHAPFKTESFTLPREWRSAGEYKHCDLWEGSWPHNDQSEGAPVFHQKQMDVKIWDFRNIFYL